jgi:hypothetical protein
MCPFSNNLCAKLNRKELFLINQKLIRPQKREHLEVILAYLLLIKIMPNEDGKEIEEFRYSLTIGEKTWKIY